MTWKSNFYRWFSTPILFADIQWNLPKINKFLYYFGLIYISQNIFNAELVN